MTRTNHAWASFFRGRREADPHMPVRINGIQRAPGSEEFLTVRELAEGEFLRIGNECPSHANFST